MTRTPRTPRQRAEEALAVSERKISRAKKKRDALAAQVKTLDAEIAAEEKQRAYLAQNPALPKAPSTSVSSVQPATGGVLMNDADA